MPTCETKIFPWIHLRIPIKVMRLQEYILWNKTAEPCIYNLLHSYIVRAEQDSVLGNYIFENFYQKGKLCARYSVEDLGKLSQMSVGSVSKHLNNMENKGYINIIRRPWHGNIINFYEFGTHDIRDDDYFEHLYAWKVMKSNNANSKLDALK